MTDQPMTPPPPQPPPGVRPPGSAGLAPMPAMTSGTYPGKFDAATLAFQQDLASRMAPLGYAPVTQVYQQGSWGCGAVGLALLLCLFVFGLLVLFYMLLVKPAGSLLVTYEWRGYPPGTTPERVAELTSAAAAWKAPREMVPNKVIVGFVVVIVVIVIVGTLAR